MLDRDTRAAILQLHRKGHGSRRIAQALDVSRNAVRDVIRSGQVEVPALERPEQLAVHLPRVRELYAECRGNLVRVQEVLQERDGLVVAYSTLTGFCRRYRIGTKPKTPAGRYRFEPGEEMQHDTSPHSVKVGERVQTLQCASLVLCFSRMLFAQVYPRWSRFECRVFLSAALEYFGGAAKRCMLDNSAVIVAHGNGADMMPAPEMIAFAKRFDFTFVAHELGDKDRSARVERNFDYIENNFYPGRTFSGLADTNEQMRDWCDGVNRRLRRQWGGPSIIPLELFQVERPLLRPLPLHIPEVYNLHRRRVDVEGYVNLHQNRYSVPVELIGRSLDVRETIGQVRLFDGHRLVAEHPRSEPGQHKRSTLPEHHGQTRWRRTPAPPSPEEKALRAAAPELEQLVDRLRKRHGGRALRAVRQLHRMYVDYPSDVLVDAVRQALHFGLIHLGRIEQMTLTRIRGDFFQLDIEPDDEGNDADG